jgi:CTP-dependent riboflavin kinase
MASKEKTVMLKGRIAVGVGRGKDMIRKYADRMHGIFGFMPHLGTLNVELENKVDIRRYETKRIDHILMDGKPMIEMRMAPVKLYFQDKTIDCWMIRQEIALHEPNIIELVAEDDLKAKFGLKDLDEVRVEFTETKRDMFGRVKRVPQIVYTERRIMR